MKVANTLVSNDSLLNSLKELTGGDLPTIVIDATGNPQSMARCFDLIAPGERLFSSGSFKAT